MAAPGALRFLLTFDLDETIVDENSEDSAVRAPRRASGCLRACVPPSARASTTSTCSASSGTWASRACGRGTCAPSTRLSACRPARASCCSLWPSRAPALRLFSSPTPTPLAWRVRCAPPATTACSVASSAARWVRPLGAAGAAALPRAQLCSLPRQHVPAQGAQRLPARAGPRRRALRAPFLRERRRQRLLPHGAAGRRRRGLPAPLLPHAPPYAGGAEGRAQLLPRQGGALGNLHRSAPTPASGAEDVACRGHPGGEGLGRWGSGKRKLVLLLPFPFVLVHPSRISRNPRLVHLGTGGGSWELSPSVQLTQLGCLPQFHCKRIPESGRTRVARISEQAAVFPQTLSSQLGGRGSLSGSRRNMSRRVAVNCCLGLRGLPPLVFCPEDPGTKMSSPDPSRIGLPTERGGAPCRRSQA